MHTPAGQLRQQTRVARFVRITLNKVKVNQKFNYAQFQAGAATENPLGRGRRPFARLAVAQRPSPGRTFDRREHLG